MSIQDCIKQIQHELDHLGACSTKDLTDTQIAQIDERFFLACEKLIQLKERHKNKAGVL